MFDSLTSFILLVTLFYFLFVKKTTTAVQTTHRFEAADAHLASITYTGITIPQQQQAENPLAYQGYRSKCNKTTQYFNGWPLWKIKVEIVILVEFTIPLFICALFWNYAPLFKFNLVIRLPHSNQQNRYFVNIWFEFRKPVEAQAGPTYQSTPIEADKTLVPSEQDQYLVPPVLLQAS